jgi:glycosyltransferase involved in cell wall biosynthesis
VGSLNRVKDHGTLLHAFALLQRRGVAVELDCVGEDTLDGAVQRLAGELELGTSVRFHGFLPHAALRPLFDQAHALVVSSRHEADPIAALEAAMAGLAVVGTAVGHLAEWVPEAALTCSPRDAAGLAATMAALAESDDLRLRLADAAQHIAVFHDAERGARRVLSLYEEVIRAHR